MFLALSDCFIAIPRCAVRLQYLGDYDALIEIYIKKQIIYLYIPIRRTAYVCVYVYVYQMCITIWHEKTSDTGPRDRDMLHVWNVK